MRHIDALRQVIAGEAEPPPIAKLIGFRLAELDEGRAVVEFDAEPRHWNPQGTLHGGIMCDVCDAAMGMAFASTLPGEVSFTTVELKINFLRPVFSGRLTAIGTIVKAGRTIALTECELLDDQQRLVAKASSTCMVLVPGR